MLEYCGAIRILWFITRHFPSRVLRFFLLETRVQFHLFVNETPRGFAASQDDDVSSLTNAT